MIGWTWDGTADGASGCGVSDDEDRARLAAEEWLRANPHGSAQLGMARLDDGLRTLSTIWVPLGERQESGHLRDGRVTWARMAARLLSQVSTRCRPPAAPGFPQGRHRATAGNAPLSATGARRQKTGDRWPGCGEVTG